MHRELDRITPIHTIDHETTENLGATPVIANRDAVKPLHLFLRHTEIDRAFLQGSFWFVLHDCNVTICHLLLSTQKITKQSLWKNKTLDYIW